MRATVILLAVLAAAPATAQVVSRAAPPPSATAESESWYRLGEPIAFADSLYYRAGATVFFNGDTMVRTGYYNGVPLYADTTLEPYSVILVPIGNGLMQPYERRRTGDLAGTTGSRTPSFPVEPATGTAPSLQAPSAPTALPVPIESAAPASPPIAVSSLGEGTTTAAATTFTPLTTPARATEIATAVRPRSNEGIWIRYDGQQWVSAGQAVAFDASRFVRVGAYAGFPVYQQRRAARDTIYVPSRAGLVAPYRKK
jgi:hypothetical protein